LTGAIGKLPDVYRQVVEMYDLKGHSADEVATALGRTQGAMFMVRKRAHRLLAELMGAPSRFLSGPG
jgi:DNA-directed RNA polymerase specialized sigma24 family protein